MVHHNKPKGFPERLDCCGQGHDKGWKFKWIFFATSSLPPPFFVFVFCCCPVICVVLPSFSQVHCSAALSLQTFSGICWSLFQCNIAKHLLTMLISSSKSRSQLECASPPERETSPHTCTHSFALIYSHAHATLIGTCRWCWNYNI